MSISPTGDISERFRSVSRCAATTAVQAGSIALPAGLYRTVVDHMWRSLPYEGVGLLATSATGDRLVANRFYAGRNLDRSTTRYTMDPADVLSALSDMNRRGTRLGAVVHSHPQTLPVPSVTHLAEASIPGVLSLIVGFFRWFEPVPGISFSVSMESLFEGKRSALRSDEPGSTAPIATDRASVEP